MPCDTRLYTSRTHCATHIDIVSRNNPETTPSADLRACASQASKHQRICSGVLISWFTLPSNIKLSRSGLTAFAPVNWFGQLITSNSTTSIDTDPAFSTPATKRWLPRFFPYRSASPSIWAGNLFPQQPDFLLPEFCTNTSFDVFPLAFSCALIAKDAARITSLLVTSVVVYPPGIGCWAWPIKEQAATNKTRTAMPVTIYFILPSLPFADGHNDEITRSVAIS